MNPDVGDLVFFLQRVLRPLPALLELPGDFVESDLGVTPKRFPENEEPGRSIYRQEKFNSSTVTFCFLPEGEGPHGLLLVLLVELSASLDFLPHVVCFVDPDLDGLAGGKLGLG